MWILIPIVLRPAVGQGFFEESVLVGRNLIVAEVYFAAMLPAGCLKRGVVDALLVAVEGQHVEVIGVARFSWNLLRHKPAKIRYGLGKDLRVFECLANVVSCSVELCQADGRVV